VEAERLAPDVRWTVPAVDIEDAPRFRWRGHMLDSSRHMQSVAFIKRTLDRMAYHKLNVFHWHIVDDNGWRLESKRYPRLTEVGGWRTRTRVGLREPVLWDERPHGGHYTQDDIREIVAYAAARHVTVVPEIDVPGHSQAAIAAYPELGNTDVVDTDSLGVLTSWGVNPNVLAPSEAVLRFYEDVLTEVLDLFPSTFVHLGGDECPKDQWRASPAAQARLRELGLDVEVRELADSTRTAQEAAAAVGVEGRPDRQVARVRRRAVTASVSLRRRSARRHGQARCRSASGEGRRGT
jgi:hexosaminidase